MSFEINITPEMKRQFASEVAEHLDNFEKMLIVLEKDPANEEAIHSGFRSIHSIKGNSSYIGLKDIDAVSHELENLMDGIRSREVRITRDILSLLFECLDLLRDMNRRVTDKDYKERDVSPIISRLRNVKELVGEEAVQFPRRGSQVDVESVFARSSLQHIEYIKGLANRILAGGSAKGAKKNILNILKTFRISANYAGFTDIAAIVKEMENRVQEVKSVRKRMAEYLLDKLRNTEELVTEIGALEPGRDESAAMDGTILSEELSREIRIGPEKIDELIGYASELIIAKNSLKYLTRKIVAGQTVSEWKDELNRVSANIDKISDNLQTSVIKLRLVQISSLFDRLPRIARDLSVRGSKKVELSLLGGETEIDNKVIEHLAMPLIHLIRNAVDHGIELPAERLRKGKAEEGSIIVKAHQEGNYVIIDVIDDGRGLDIGEIKREALRREIITQEALESMTDDEIMNLTFTPGYSTAAGATSVSGRGVGLDIVRSNVNFMGGNAAISSEPGIATRVRLQVPFTMAMTDVLLTEVSGEKYAFPFSSVLESIKVERGKIQTLNKREVIPYYGTVLSLRYLGEILGIAKSGKLRVKASDEQLAVVVVAFGGQICGIVVDQVLRRESILARPLEEQFSSIEEFSGASILGDGSIVLVLDPVGILRR
jgi:two-component system chemotaxis sensor kinase CheA